ncbi:hypothetical protein EV191_101930 [Tamaricihabitans halophyticus]|uniref:Uncharacterized protein n=1 Tax=Tamaricihabitans halophyticus TaxID=1262583 RepID=A0A4R2R2K8_9PSEU|nr:hypothetical protein [Tamaricihabitans halophyticus]TCP56980.1 hypothetical protein EV191_101930 [Tamaricihabitans halophyticus]
MLPTSTHAALKKVLNDKPASIAPVSDRVAWLLDLAEALSSCGSPAEANEVYDSAIDLVHDVATRVAGGVAA